MVLLVCASLKHALGCGPVWLRGPPSLSPAPTGGQEVRVLGWALARALGRSRLARSGSGRPEPMLWQEPDVGLTVESCGGRAEACPLT